MDSSSRIVDSAGVQLATESWGEPRRGTILLVMGATASMLWWPTSLLAALAAGGYRVIRFDHRDTGHSTTHAAGDVRYDVPDLAADLIAILDAYGAQSAHLVGMSLGGYLAQIVALQHPERVATMTLIAAEPLGLTYDGEGMSPALLEHFASMATLDWADRAGVAAFMLRIAELSAGPAAPFDRKAASARIAHEIERSPSIQSAFNHAMLAGALPAGLAASAITQPVLAIHGSADPVISPNAARTLVAAVPGAELLLIEGRGHELLDSDVPQLAAAILRHCASRAAQ